MSFIMIAFLSLNGIAADEKNAVDVNPPAVEESAPVQAPDPKEPEGYTKEEAPDIEAPRQEAPAPEAPVKEEPSELHPGNITVNFKGADIRTVLSYISEVSGVDIVAAPDVKGAIDLRLTDKPWKVALDVIVRNYGFAYERDGDIIRVVTLDRLKQEEVITQAMILNYGKAKDVVDAIKNIVGERGKVMYDERTNMVIVTDIPTNIYKIGQIINRLDRKTQQVLIEARIIETTLNKDEKLGIDWNVKISAKGASRPTTFPFPKWTKEDNRQNNFYPIAKYAVTQEQIIDNAVWVPNPNWDGIDPLAQFIHPYTDRQVVTSDFAPNNMFDDAVSGLNRFSSFPMAAATDFKYGTLDFSEFKAVLEMLKSRSDTDTISNPRITTLNNVKANINVGEQVNIPKFERNSQTGKMEITGYDPRDTGIVLKVTPHINDGGEIAMEIAPEVTEFLGYQPVSPGSEIFAPIFFTRTADTQVMIKDGQTIFIGGLITTKNVDARTKLPIIGDMLGDVPFLGLLFSHKGVIQKKTELIFFITVNIVSSDRVITGVPLPDKTDKPEFTDTQRGDTLGDKKNKKRLKREY